MICDTRWILFSVCECVCVCRHILFCPFGHRVWLQSFTSCAVSKVEQGMVQAVRLIEEERMSTGRGDRAGGVSSLSPDTSPKLWDGT